jgi:photosystem II stability/assembly factor-like uncharacterized protein
MSPRFTPLLLWLIALTLPLSAQSRFYACGVTSKDWVVGAKLPPSGLYSRMPDGSWQHTGYNHPYIAAIDYDPRDPSVLYFAAGNGCIRATQHGRDWKILTAEDVTELRDISLDPNAAGTIYFAHTAGIRVSRDSGATWQDVSANPRRPYTEAVKVDRTRAGHLVAGLEDGLYFSSDGGLHWRHAGAAGFAVMHIRQSPHDASLWLATTRQGGVFVSRNGGRSFENLHDVGVYRNTYDVAFHPQDPQRIAVAGWGPGVLVSEDGGRTFHARNHGLPRYDVWSVAFDPAKPDRMYASVHEEALFVSDDGGRSWQRGPLEGSVIYRMVAVPEVRP